MLVSLGEGQYTRTPVVRSPHGSRHEAWLRLSFRDLTLTVGVSCSEAVASARVFVTLRRGGTTCVNSYHDLSLPAGSERNVDVSGFVVQAACRPVPFTADDLWVRLYDLAGSPTTPLGEAVLPVSYRIN
jgi:hypothetical protein